ncbi:GNAT family N-acetyltransferase [Chitinimonas naiadis]
MSTSITLSTPTLADAAPLLAFELANRAYFESWINARPASYYSLDAVRDAIQAAERESAADVAYQFLIRQQDAIVGRINLTQVTRPYYNKATLGYRVGESFAGQGIAGQALALLLDRAFGELDLHRIEATARPENRGSMRVLERNGFQQFGRATRAMLLDGGWYDLLYYERHRDDTGPVHLVA